MTFASQKGAKQNQLFMMEENIKHIFKLLKYQKKQQIADFAGAGAAGGIGFTMKYFFHSKIASGIDQILEMIDFKTLVKTYDVIITGEGKFDKQSLDGKVFSGIKKYQPQRLIVICGQNQLKKKDEEIYAIVPTVASLEESFKDPVLALQKLLPFIKIK